MASGPAYHAVAIFLVNAIRKATQKRGDYGEGYKDGITKALNELAKEDGKKGTPVTGKNVLESMTLLAKLEGDKVI